jgi:hypothetical protein
MIHWLSLLCGLPVGLFTLLLLLLYPTAVGHPPTVQAARPGSPMRTITAQGVITTSGVLTGTLPLSYSYLPFISRQDLIVTHGGFEEGPGIWQEFSRKGQRLVRPATELAVPPGNGNWAARLGSVDDEIAMLSQGITIPKGQSCLVYWQWTVSSDACRADYGGVGINGNWIVKESLCAGTATGQWMRRQISMSKYTTQTVVLNFAVTNDYSSPSIMYIDDIAFASKAACESRNQNTFNATNLTVIDGSHPIVPSNDHPATSSIEE